MTDKDIPETYWNYRVVAKSSEGHKIYEIHECHYEGEKCVGVSEAPIPACGDNVEELKEDLERMLKAFELDVIVWGRGEE